MIKIIKKQYHPHSISKSGFWDYLLVPDLLNLAPVDDNSAIISRVSVSNGTAKTTYAKRFDDLNNKLLKYLSKERELYIHDVAVSSGITSMELYNFLKSQGYKVKYNFSDKFTKLYYFKEKGRTYFFDTDGNYAFGYIGGFLASKFVSKLFFGTKFLWYRTHNSALKKFNPQLSSILLLNSKVLELADSDSNFQFIDYDLFLDSKNDHYDIIRAMNILNPIYFSDVQLTKALRLIHASLKNNGVFLVGRTHIEDGKNYATFFRKTDFGFSLLENVNSGSEIVQMVENFKI